MDNRRKITPREMSKDFLEENDGEGIKKKLKFNKRKNIKKHKKKEKTLGLRRDRGKNKRQRGHFL